MANVHPTLTHGLWFDNQAEEAARFYTSLFPNSSIRHIARYGKEGFEYHGQPEGAVMSVEFNLSGLGFTALNGGPKFSANPSITFFVACTSKEEVDRLYIRLSENGNVLVPLGKYDWSEHYAWVQDRYGIAWELMPCRPEDVVQKISPSLVFTSGRAEEAVRFYTSVFDNSAIAGILKYKKGEGEPEGTVKHCMFSLMGQQFMAADYARFDFPFNEAITIIINCDTQTEIDLYWSKLTEGGEEGPCGWLKDKFGVSWQIEPVQLSEMMKHPDKEKVGKVSKAFMQMKKFDIQKLEEAFSS